MSMRVRADYINPLSMMEKSHIKSGSLFPKSKSQTTEALQNKRQQLQNQMLLLKASGTDGAGAAPETRKALEAELEAVSADLRAAKNEPVPDVEPMEGACLDRYEPVKTESFGSYRVERDEDSGYQILFTPYAEKED